jgi:putative hydrolase of the HAD superfamily
MTSNRVSTLFLDVGGVLGTNGWDSHMRRRAAERFGLDFADMDQRHNLTFDTYEVGKLCLNEYLDRVVFFRPRSFTYKDFRAFMFEQSVADEPMIALVRRLKERHRLRVTVVSNEGRELTLHRIEKFRLNEFVDAFIASSFVHFRKPDADIYRIALDVSQTTPKHVAYVDDRAMFVEVAQGLGIHGIQHTSYDSTRAALTAIGLDDGGLAAQSK